MPRSQKMPSAALPSNHYFVRSRQPLPSLVLLLPLIIAYEIGAYLYVAPVTGDDVVARQWLIRFFDLFGSIGEFLAGLAVVVVLLCWHVAKRDRWVWEPGVYAAMALESVALAVPALIFGMLAGRHTPGMLTTIAESTPYGADLFFSIGAGIYEELVFRLILIALLHAIVVDVIGGADQAGALVAVLGSSVLFGLYHFTGKSPHDFSWPLMIYFTLIGLYFAIIYVLRGFGIAAATHALLDIVIVTLNHQSA